MNLKNKVYQMFMIAPQESSLKSGGNLEYALKSGLGGVIFFTKNILTVEQTKNFVNEIKKVSLISPFIGIDEEGGRVERTENIFGGKKFLSAKYQVEKNCVKSQSKEIAELIKSLGFNMNFSPVLDINTNPKNPIIGERAYGESVNIVEKYAIEVMKTYIENGIIPVGKHFPGHGDVDIDSHLSLPTLKLGFDEVENIHIKPFKSAIERGLPAIMVAHLYCPCFDVQKIPSSLSFNVMSYLRKELNFAGVIVSDDMQMGALQSIDPVDAVIMGVRAGVNLFLYRDSSSETVGLIEAVYNIVNQDEELKEKVCEAYECIRTVKSRYNRFL